MPTVFAYARASTAKQEMTLEAQREQLQKYYAYRFSDHALRHGEAKPEWGGVYVDDDTSGEIPLHEREEGGEIVRRIQSGDHFLVCKCDRAFRSFRDAWNVIDTWVARGIVVHVLNFGADTATPAGVMVLQMLSAAAQFERAMIAERTRDAMRYRRAHGLSVGGRPKPWQANTGPRGKRYGVDDPKKIAILEEILRLSNQGLSPYRIAVMLTEQWAAANRGMWLKKNATPARIAWFRDWSAGKVRQCLVGWTAEKARRAEKSGVKADGAVVTR